MRPDCVLIVFIATVIVVMSVNAESSQSSSQHGSPRRRMDAVSSTVTQAAVQVGTGASCSAYFAIVILPPPTQNCQQQGSFWGGIDKLWANVALTIDSGSILWSQPRACVDFITTPEMLPVIPASLTSDPLARVAVFATNVNQSEYHCWVVPGES